MKLIVCILAIALGLVLLWPSAETPWQLTTVTGHLPDLQFAMTDDKGKHITERDVHGSVVIVYFGFTGCPDLCPTTLARMARVFKTMGKEADDLRLLFVTIDPAHDSQQQLHDYLGAIDAEHMTGLRGSEADITELTKRFRAAYDSGSVMHSDTLYIFDRNAHARLIATGADTDESLALDLQRLGHERP